MIWWGTDTGDYLLTTFPKAGGAEPAASMVG